MRNVVQITEHSPTMSARQTCCLKTAHLMQQCNKGIEVALPLPRADCKAEQSSHSLKRVAQLVGAGSEATPRQQFKWLQQVLFTNGQHELFLSFA